MLYPPKGTLARLVDTVLLLDDGEQQAHADRLCHGILRAALALELDRQAARPLRLPLPGCRTKETDLFLRLVYSTAPKKMATRMSLRELMDAGTVAGRFAFSHIYAVIERGLLEAFYGRSFTELHFVNVVSSEDVFELLHWAEGVHSAQIATLCGAYIAKYPKQFETCKHTWAVAFQAAMQVAQGQAVPLPP